MRERVRCPYCHEWVTVDNRRWPLGDPSARAHMKRCPFSPIKIRERDVQPD